MSELQPVLRDLRKVLVDARKLIELFLLVKDHLEQHLDQITGTDQAPQFIEPFLT